MRVIAGVAKGKRLQSPPGMKTRPMTDRAREGLFSSLGARVIDAFVIDLYAGSGSLGLEALSRGAAGAIFVERDRQAAGALRRNVETVGLGGEVVVGDVTGFLAGSDAQADLVFVDPPYELALASVGEVLAHVVDHLRTKGTVIVHRRRGGDPPIVAGLALMDRRTYGDTELFKLRKEDH